MYKFVFSYLYFIVLSSLKYGFWHVREIICKVGADLNICFIFIINFCRARKDYGANIKNIKIKCLFRSLAYEITTEFKLP